MLSALTRSKALRATIAATGALGTSIFIMQDHASMEEQKFALSPDEWRSFPLKYRMPLTHNTDLYRFATDGASGLPVASCVLIKGKVQLQDGTVETVVRPYTPISPKSAEGYIDFAIKRYPNGKVSNYLHGMVIGDKVEIKGPIMKFQYQPNSFKHIGMIAGGTGITPMLQVAEEILTNPEDKTKVSLIFANVTDNDIILKDRIDAIAKAHPDRFRVQYVVEKPRLWGLMWKGGVGYVTPTMISEFLPTPTEEGVKIMVCGPPPMMESICGNKKSPRDQGPLTGHLKTLAYSEDQVFKF